MNRLKGVSLYQRFIQNLIEMQSLIVTMSSANKKLLKYKRNNELSKVFLMMAQSISDVFVQLILDNIEMDILILLRAQTWLLLAMGSIKLPCGCHVSMMDWYDGLFTSPTNPLLSTFFACIMVATNCSAFTRSSTLWPMQPPTGIT